MGGPTHVMVLVDGAKYAYSHELWNIHNYGDLTCTCVLGYMF